MENKYLPARYCQLIPHRPVPRAPALSFRASRIAPAREERSARSIQRGPAADSANGRNPWSGICPAIAAISDRLLAQSDVKGARRNHHLEAYMPVLLAIRPGVGLGLRFGNQ